MFGFGKSKAPRANELVKNTREALALLEKNDPKAAERATEEISRNLAAMKGILYGDPDTNAEPNQDAVVTLANDIYSNDFIPLLLTHLAKFEFEAKKDVALIFNNLLRRQVGNRSPTVDYLCRNVSVLETLCKSYENPDVALNCGAMLRECTRHESLTKLIIHSPNIWKFFRYVEMTNFDVASDAFLTFKDILTKHKLLVAEFLEKNYDQFFEYYTALLNSPNYVTRRQSLKLLGELLLDRANFNIMTKYISESSNLKLMMSLLKDKKPSIQFEAFHVFKVFIANPNKPPSILNILNKNKDKLVTFLSNFQNDKEDDQFNDEKAFLLKQIQQLTPANA